MDCQKTEKYRANRKQLDIGHEYWTAKRDLLKIEAKSALNQQGNILLVDVEIATGQRRAALGQVDSVAPSMPNVLQVRKQPIATPNPKSPSGP
jgi:hypothetical protein